MPIYPTNPNNLHDEVYHGKKDAVLPLTSIIGIAGDDTPTVDWEAKYHKLEETNEVQTKNHHDQHQRMLIINQYLKDWIVDLLDDAR